jgi:CubicO group peptidase (beta-lactamase class C family)
MKTKLSLLPALVWFLAFGNTDPCLAASPNLPRSAPEAQGIASDALLAFVGAADESIDGLHSLMLLRHGKVVAEGWWTPYNAESPHELYSLSKSFTSTAVGLAIAEGRMSLDDTILAAFPADAPAQPGPNLKEMRVRDLLCMSTGHEQEPPITPDRVSPQSFLAQPVPFKPGTRFLYNTAATFMLSAMVQKATGQTLLDYLQPRLFEPLGIPKPTWQTNAQGIALGGYGLSVRTEDIARFGQLYLDQGRWNGQPILPADWVRAATSRQTSNGSNPKSDWDQGYGYQFWRSRHGAYRGDGAFGQYCIVLPEQDAVLAITSGVKDMQAVLNLVWDRLLPALQPGSLPANPDAQARLKERLARLTLRTPAGQPSSPLASSLAGRTFVFPTNDQQLETIRLEPTDVPGAHILAVRARGAEQRLRCPHGQWQKNRYTWGPYPERPVATSGAWASDDTYLARICFYETPSHLTFRLRFAGDELTVESELNVAFGPTRQPTLVGRRQ